MVVVVVVVSYEFECPGATSRERGLISKSIICHTLEMHSFISPSPVSYLRFLTASSRMRISLGLPIERI